MGFMDSLKNFVAPADDDDQDDDLEYGEEQPAAAPAAAPATSAYENKMPEGVTPLDPNTKMVLFEPRSFGEVEAISQRLKEGRAVVVNMHKLDGVYTRRMIDFLSGVVFALSGKIQGIGDHVILCYPKEIVVAGNINFARDGEDHDAE